MLGVLLIALVVAVARPAKPAATVAYSEPNFDSVRPVFVRPERPVVEGPTIREEEDAFVIEDPVDVVDDAMVDVVDNAMVDTIDDAMVDSIHDSTDDSTNNPHIDEMDISFAKSEPVSSEESIVDLGDTVSGSSLQGSMIAVLFVSCSFSPF